MQPTLRVQLLGDFCLARGTTLVTSVNSPRIQSLLAFLVLHRDVPQPRNHIAYTFWTDITEASARNNLRQLLFELRRTLPNADQFLVVDNATIQWRTNAAFTLEISWPFFVAGVGVGLSRWLFLQDSRSVPYWIGLYVLAQSQLIGGGDAKLLLGAFGLWPDTAFFLVLVGVFVGWGIIYVIWRYREQVIARLGARLSEFVRTHGDAAGQPRQAATWAVALVIGGWLIVH